MNKPAGSASIGVFASMLAACASYSPLPLPTEDGLLVDFKLLAPTSQPVAQVDVADGLDMTEAAVLAVALNPLLEAERRRYAVAAAQLFATRLLPDPQIGIGIDRPDADEAGLVDARSLSLNYDLLALLTRAPAVRSERQATEQIRLDLAWQEWQVAQQARLLFVRERTAAAKLELLAAAVADFEQRQAMSARALAEGNLTIDSAGPDLTALLDAKSQFHQVQQQHIQTRHELKSLLGLTPEAALDLSSLPRAPDAEPLDGAALLPDIVSARPDLLALQAGYSSQEAKLRLAAWRFFPALAVGVNRARDTGNILTSGVSISLDLPVFSGNRGAVRVERAAREQLRTEYTARLAQVRTDVGRLADERKVLDERRTFLVRHLPTLERMVVEARRAYSNRDMDSLVFINLESSLMNKRIELLDLEQAVWEIAIALDTITAQPPSS